MLCKYWRAQVNKLGWLSKLKSNNIIWLTHAHILFLHAHTCTYSYTQARTLTHFYTQEHIPTHRRTHSYTQAHTPTHFYISTHKHTHLHTYTHKHTYLHTITHTSTHSYAHEHTYIHLHGNNENNLALNCNSLLYKHFVPYHNIRLSIIYVMQINTHYLHKHNIFFNFIAYPSLFENIIIIIIIFTAWFVMF